MKRIKFITLVHVSEMKDRTISPIVQLIFIKDLKLSKYYWLLIQWKPHSRYINPLRS